MNENFVLPTAPGYEAPSTHAFNEADAHLFWGNDGVLDDFYPIDSSILPSQITLTARLDGTRIESACTGQFIIDQEPLKEARIYDASAIQTGSDLFEHGHYQNLKLLFAGDGYITHKGHTYTLADAEQFDWIVAPESILYVKNFVYERANIVERYFSESGLHLSPATTGHILRPFGGYLSSNLQHCAQICYELCEEFPQTTKLSLVRLKDALTSNEPFVFSHPHMPRTSLHDDLIKGALHVSLTDTLSGASFPYYSHHYDTSDDNQITIHFVKPNKEN
jgi:hypothetical protein